MSTAMDSEIIIPNGGGHHGSEQVGLYVLGSDDGSWLGGRMTWNQHAYNIVNINDDLSIPATPDSNWPPQQLPLGRLNPVYGQYAPDAVPLGDVCMDDCAMGLIRLGVASVTRDSDAPQRPEPQRLPGD